LNGEVAPSVTRPPFLAAGESREFAWGVGWLGSRGGGRGRRGKDPVYVGGFDGLGVEVGEGAGYYSLISLINEHY
jgi:hypothetical protein